jgi:inner membrane protein
MGVIVFSGAIHWRMCLLLWILWYFQTGVWVNPVIALFATLLPDADHPKAPMGRFIPLHLFCKHRGFTHSFEGMFLFSLPCLFISVNFWISFLFGYLVHLWMDAMTYTSVKWFYFYKRKKSLPF